MTGQRKVDIFEVIDNDSYPDLIIAHYIHVLKYHKYSINTFNYHMSVFVFKKVDI
jgi:hypothetical protein